jgi:hypothetical protein
MADYKALTDLIVAGKPVAKGKTFTAPEDAVRSALAAGLVAKAPTKKAAK